MKLSFMEAVSIKNSNRKVAYLAELYSISPQTVRKTKRGTWKELITTYTEATNELYGKIAKIDYKDGYFYVLLDKSMGIYAGTTITVRESFLLSSLFRPTFPIMTTKSKITCIYRLFKQNGGKNIKIVPLGKEGLSTKFIAVVDGNRYYWNQIITLIEKSLY